MRAQGFTISLARFLILGLVAISCLVHAQTNASRANADYAFAYSHGEALVRDHQWDQGLALLRPLLKSSQADVRLLNLIGLAYTGKGDPAEGDTYFEAALKANPEFVPALKNIGINEFGMGKFTSAEQHLHAALQVAPDDPIIRMYLGEAAFQKQDYAHAAEYLQGAGSKVIGDFKVRLSLALSYLKTDNKDGAVSLLDGLPPEALAPQAQAALGVSLAEGGLSVAAIPYLKPAWLSYSSAPDLGYDLALCELGARQYTQAIATIHELTAAGHETSELDNILSEAYEGNKETQSAVDALRRAISLDPKDDNNYLDFATLCINHQDFNNAGKVLEVGLAVHPQSARLLFERGILNAMQDHFDQAEKDFEGSAMLAPKDNSGYIGLGVTYIETGNTAQAIQILRKRLVEAPNSANLSYLLGEALIRSGAQPGEPNFLEARVSLERSVRLDPTLSAPHAALGGVYLNEGKAQAAVDQLEQARALDPKEKSAYAHLAVAYRRLAEPDKVKEVLSRLQQINAEEREDPRQKMKEGASASSLPMPSAH